MVKKDKFCKRSLWTPPNPSFPQSVLALNWIRLSSISYSQRNFYANHIVVISFIIRKIHENGNSFSFSYIFEKCFFTVLFFANISDTWLCKQEWMNFSIECLDLTNCFCHYIFNAFTDCVCFFLMFPCSNRAFC